MPRKKKKPQVPRHKRRSSDIDDPRAKPRELPEDVQRHIEEIQAEGFGDEAETPPPCRFVKNMDIHAARDTEREKQDRFFNKSPGLLAGTEKEKQAIPTRKLVEDFGGMISEMVLRGYMAHQIASKLALQRHQVAKVISVCRRKWAAEWALRRGDLIGAELARLSMVENAAWEEYERSKLPKKRLTKRSKTNADGGTEDERSKMIEGRDGNPKFMDIVLACIRQRCELLNLLKPDDQSEKEFTALLVEVRTPVDAQNVISFMQAKNMVEGQVIENNIIRDEPIATTTTEETPIDG